jgi:hypothetical protein
MKARPAFNASTVTISWLVLLFGLAFAPPTFAQQEIGHERIDDNTKQAIIDSICVVIDTVYVFPDVAEQMQTYVRTQLANGAYDDIDTLVDFTDKLTEDLRSICHDLHLNVIPASPEQFEQPDSAARQQQQEAFLMRARHDNFGFRKVERLPGNVGYLRFDQFMDASIAGHKAIAAMKFLSDCDAIIFDLRHNGGGSPSMIQLISSYLFEEPVHLNSFYIRALDSIQQFWTQAYVDGRRMPDIPVYVLTSSYTFSGAEEFTYNLKNLERATIVGETTGGGAHPVEWHQFAGVNVRLKIPFGRAINPISGTNWEGTGVEPDISVPAEQALQVAHVDALKKLLETTTEEQEKTRIEWTIEGVEAALNPVHLEASELKKYEGTYGPRRIWLENGVLKYQRQGRPAYTMYPMGDHLFGIEGLDYFRLRFEVEGGEVSGVIGLYDNGQQDVNERSSS